MSNSNSMRYAIWNNKGGVGKTFLSFVLSSEYAIKHKNKNVLVVDMCPQANLSEILLGGNSNGSKLLGEFIEKRKTIGGYIDTRIINPHSNKTGLESDYVIQVSKYNKEIPENLHLIVGDSKLEVQTQVINQISGQSAPKEAWKNVHSWLLHLILPVINKIGGEVTTFIDCNPSFSAYTEIALLASEQIIVPCSSDGSSARAIDNIKSLVYGKDLPDSLQPSSFSKKASEFDMSLPKVHSVILNRSTQYKKTASRAFGVMFEEIKKRVEKFKASDRDCFYNGFKYHVIHDAHSPTIVCSHQGLPISTLQVGHHRIHNITCQVNKESLNRYKIAIKSFVDSLA